MSRVFIKTTFGWSCFQWCFFQALGSPSDGSKWLTMKAGMNCWWLTKYPELIIKMTIFGDSTHFPGFCVPCYFHFHDCGMKSKSKSCKYLETSVQIDCLARLKSHQEKSSPSKWGSVLSLLFVVEVPCDAVFVHVPAMSSAYNVMWCRPWLKMSDVNLRSAQLWATLSLPMVWYISYHQQRAWLGCA